MENEIQKLTESLNESKRQRDDESNLSKKKSDEFSERCRQLNDDLRRSIEDKRLAELRCDQLKSTYEEYMDNVANQVGQALTRQQVRIFFLFLFRLFF